jgi:hypothetical protein
MKDQAEMVAQAAGGAPVRYLDFSDPADRPNEKFLFYARMVVGPVGPRELCSHAGSSDRVLVIASAGARHDQALDRAGFTPIAEFSDVAPFAPQSPGLKMMDRDRRRPAPQPNQRLRRLWEHRVTAIDKVTRRESGVRRRPTLDVSRPPANVIGIRVVRAVLNTGRC